MPQCAEGHLCLGSVVMVFFLGVWGYFQVVLVRWNEPFQKLATCDMEGGIFVWIQYEGRWSVELVNDRGAQVPWTHYAGHCIYTHRHTR